jgi:hypothetical protein
MQQDPHEWTNRATDPACSSILAHHRTLVPTSSLPPAPGSSQRILLYDPASGAVNWEGMAVSHTDPIPELEDEPPQR